MLGAEGSKVCRGCADYDQDDHGSPFGIENLEHPLRYAEAAGAMAQQSFLAIRAAGSCPVDTPAPASRRFLGSATVQHQPDVVATRR